MLACGEASAFDPPASGIAPLCIKPLAEVSASTAPTIVACEAPTVGILHATGREEESPAIP